ncbi:RNA polymerase-associated protein RapA [Enhygromyxa salina]|uniref:RNA polymerase-associated protein RapA n=1 Tax=Enhygromyxa salina TaxID=215803 RepID=A0A2S9XUK2_9BACT|nr:protein DpdE [Enhygromyxa salina]PRP96523.1 RNA polymerase-associated protein RapA [Enhygromyxa salina]
MRFVISTASSVRGFGFGKQSLGEGRVEYFISAADEVCSVTVPLATILERRLEAQERVYFQDGLRWKVGRLDEYVTPTRISLRLPNDEWHELDIADAHVRSDLPLGDPLGLLQQRTTHTPFWHNYRADLVRAIAEQRACYRGLLGLASANVEIFAHQLLVVQRVLKDPVLRYLLADEVGLGKTIEAGTIIRQHSIDEGDEARVVVLVPDHLVDQWRAELKHRFHIPRLIEFPGESISNDPGVQVLGHRNVPRLLDLEQPPTLVVIDEAHEVARYAFEEGKQRHAFDIVSNVAKDAQGVLLLSATPVLHNEDAFLAMLHLLDPSSYDLEDRADFRARVEHRELISQAIAELDDEAPSFLVEGVLDRLEELAASAPILDQKIKELRGALDVLDDLHLAELVASLRSYLQERFRLDRRLLRTRRKQDDVRPDLPTRQLHPLNYDDPVRRAAFEWLEGWRFSTSGGEDTDEVRRVFLELLEAALIHPTTLGEAAVKRRNAIRAKTQRELFEGEVDRLARFTAAPVAEDPRLLALLQLINADIPRKKWVVFCSSPTVAAQLCSALRKKLFDKVAHVGAEDTSIAKVVADFHTQQDLIVLVCDQGGEQGLNLQGVDARLVHFDLPLSPNRIEQRIGRLDRINGNRYITSFVPGLDVEVSRRTYEDAWAECLAKVVRVFDDSVASLQHVLDAGTTWLRGQLLDEGVDAIADLAEQWQAEAGEFSLRTESRRVEQEAMLDQIEILEGIEDVYPGLDNYEYDEGANRFTDAVARWATRALDFKLHRNGKHSDTLDFEHGPTTLLTPSRLRTTFADAFVKDRKRHRPHTGWLEFDRGRAAKTDSMPIARVGHPFVEGVRKLMEHDERGRAYAMWREVENFNEVFPSAGSEALFFRFDFLIEANLDAVVQLARDRNVSLAAIARRAEEAFPPLYETVWIDIEGDEVTQVQLEQLGRAYSQNSGDKNLRDERWDPVDALGLYADWSDVCSLARERARQRLEQRTELSKRLECATDYVDEVYREAKRGLEARIQAVAGRQGDRRILALETEIHRCLHGALQPPTVRLDSVGAVVLADRPFPS